MKWDEELASLANNDNIIKSIELTRDFVKINILKWNNQKVTLVLEDYLKLKDSQSVESEIDEIVIRTAGNLLDETIDELINDTITKDEINDYSEIIFHEPWEKKIILSVIVKSAYIVKE